MVEYILLKMYQEHFKSGQTEITNEVPTCIAESNGIVFYGTKEDQLLQKNRKTL